MSRHDTRGKTKKQKKKKKKKRERNEKNIRRERAKTDRCKNTRMYGVMFIVSRRKLEIVAEVGDEQHGLDKDPRKLDAD